MNTFWKIVAFEFTCVFRDSGLLLILLGALFIYGTLYPVIYAPEVVRELPVAVVDLDQSEPSRELVRKLDATAEVRVQYAAESLEEAKTLFLDRKAYGVLLIPGGYERDLLSQTQAHVSLYADGSYFLLYSEFLTAVSNIVLETGAQVKSEQLLARPVDAKVETLFNPYGGYGTALMPAVLLVIVQQLLLIGIGMVGGTWSEQGRWFAYRDYPVGALVGAKALAYLLLYTPVIVLILSVPYLVFHYPMHGSVGDLVGLMLPYLLACIGLGLTIGALCGRRDSSMMILVSSSVFFLMWSGISWPREGMPAWMFTLGRLVPSGSGIEALVRIRIMGAAGTDAMPEVLTLWGLTALYGSTAVWAVGRRQREPGRLRGADRSRALPKDDIGAGD